MLCQQIHGCGTILSDNGSLASHDIHHVTTLLEGGKAAISLHACQKPHTQKWQ